MICRCRNVADGTTTVVAGVPREQLRFENLVRIIGVVDDLDAGFLGEGVEHLRVDVIAPIEDVDHLVVGEGGAGAPESRMRAAMAMKRRSTQVEPPEALSCKAARAAVRDICGHDAAAASCRPVKFARPDPTWEGGRRVPSSSSSGPDHEHRIVGQCLRRRFVRCFALRIALRDLRGGVAGFGIFIACIALGCGRDHGRRLGRPFVRATVWPDRAGHRPRGGPVSFDLIQRQAKPRGTRLPVRRTAACRGSVRYGPSLAPPQASGLVEVKAVGGGLSERRRR